MSMSALNALAAGDFRAMLDGILSDDRIEGQSACPCGKANDLIVVRTGCVVIIWSDMVAKHGGGDDFCLDVTSYRSVAVAMQAMDAHRAEIAQLNGMAQLINAVNGAAPVDAGLAWLLAPGN